MAVEQRVSTLETLVGQIAEQQIKTEKSLDRLSDEMVAFKREIRHDIRAFKREIRRDIRDPKEELCPSARASPSGGERVREYMKKARWDFIHRMGIDAPEDPFGPSVREVARKYFGVDSFHDYAEQTAKGIPGKPGTTRSFGVMAYTDTYFFFTQNTIQARQEEAEEFVALLSDLDAYFPEYRALVLIPVFSVAGMLDDIVPYLTRHGVYCMVIEDESVVLVNFDEVQAARAT